MNVVLYTKENCSYCTKAKTLLTARNIPYSEQKLNEDFTREFLLEMFPSALTFPVVVIDGFHIGGFTQLAEHIVQTTTNQKFLSEGDWNGA